MPQGAGELEGEGGGGGRPDRGAAKRGGGRGGKGWSKIGKQGRLGVGARYLLFMYSAG